MATGGQSGTQTSSISLILKLMGANFALRLLISLQHSRALLFLLTVVENAKYGILNILNSSAISIQP